MRRESPVGALSSSECWEVTVGGKFQVAGAGFVEDAFTGPLPSYLYRYRPLPAVFEERLEQEIGRREIWLSPFARLNDPDEGAIDFRLHGSIEALREFWRSAGLSDEAEIALRVSNTRANAGMLPPPIESDLIEQLRATVHTACFSEDPLHPLMWAHYAGSTEADGTRRVHGGVCLQYLITQASRWVGLGPVTYVHSRPVINYAEARRHTHLLRAPLFSKSLAWSYENEWRIVLYSPLDGNAQAPKLVRVPEAHLTAIILGLNSSKEVEAAVRRIVSRAAFRPAVYRVERERVSLSFRLAEVEA